MSPSHRIFPFRDPWEAGSIAHSTLLAGVTLSMIGLLSVIGLLSLLGLLV